MSRNMFLQVRSDQKADEPGSFDLAASEEGSTKSKDSGLYDDQEAPVSADTVTTVDLKEKLSRAADEYRFI